MLICAESGGGHGFNQSNSAVFELYISTVCVEILARAPNAFLVAINGVIY